VPQLLGYYPAVPGCPANASTYHNGLDFAAAQGTPIYAAASGWVTFAGRDRDDDLANTRLVIQHDGDNEGYATEYYHWIRAHVEPGDYVRAGNLIADVGSVGYSTGPHLHFTVVDATTSQAIDPTRWLPATTSNTTLADAAIDDDRVASGGGTIIVTDYIPPTPTPAPRRR
jgi:murein DD-endopeptidase MepM/ murein hydrolase activator NlpD